MIQKTMERSTIFHGKTHVRCQSHGLAAAGDAAAVGDLVRKRHGEWMKKCGKSVENRAKNMEKQ